MGLSDEGVAGAVFKVELRRLIVVLRNVAGCRHTVACFELKNSVGCGRALGRWW